MKFKAKLFIFLFTLGITASLTLSYMNAIVKPILYRECEAYAKTMLNEVVSQALAEDIANTYFDKAMNFTYNSEGYVSTYSLNMLNANKIRAYVSKEIISDIKSNNSLKLKVSTGTLSGIAFFYGKGPKLSISLSALYGITCDLTSEFTDSGINQTLHSLSLEISANTAIKEPLTTQSLSLVTTVPISETVIIGDVPEAYTLILRASEDDEGLINDYGASLS